MTVPDSFEDGDHVCGNCRYFRRLRQMLDGADHLWGCCRHILSDHCGHVLAWGHPRCAQAESLRKERA